MIMLFLLLATASLVLGARFFIIDVNEAEFLVRHFSYYDNWMVVLLGLNTIVKAAKLKGLRATEVKRHVLGAGVCFGIAIIWQLSNQAAFKMLMDEMALAATAKTYHEEREAMVPTATVQVGGEAYVATSYVDKRPTLYPFAVSFLHTFTGYRPENSFLANGIIGLGFLSLLYGWASAYYSRSVGICLVMLAGAIPIFAQQATSGGYDLLNLTMLVGLLWAGTRFCERCDADSLGALVLAGLLFARCRYESITGLAVVVVLWAAVCIKERKVILSWLVAISPLMALGPLMSNIILVNSSDSLEKPENVPTFSSDYFSENFGNAVYYLFGTERFSSAPVVALFGIMAVMVYVLRVRAAWNSWNLAEWANLGLVAWVIAATTLYMFYFWGNWTDGFATRFSMPILLLMCLSPILLSRYYGERYLRVLLCVSMAHFVVLYKPFPNTIYTDSSSYYRQENEWWMAFIEKNGTDKSLFVGDNILAPYLLEQPGVLMGNALNHYLAIEYALKTGYYTDVYVLSRYFIDPNVTRKPTFYQERLLDTFELEFQERFAIRDDVFSMIYRVRAVKAGELGPDDPKGRLIESREIDYSKLPGFYPSVESTSQTPKS